MYYTLIAYRPTGDDTCGCWTHSDCLIEVVANEQDLVEQIAAWEYMDFIEDALATFEYTVIRPNGFIDDIGQWKHLIKAEADIRINKIKEQRANNKAQEEQVKAEQKRQRELALLTKLQSQYGDK